MTKKDADSSPLSLKFMQQIAELDCEQLDELYKLVEIVRHGKLRTCLVKKGFLFKKFSPPATAAKE